MVSRRRAVALLAGGVAAVAAWCFRAASEQEAIEMVVYKRLAYLRLEPEGVRSYAMDVVAARQISPVRLKALGMFAPLYRRLPLDGHDPVQSAIRHGEERVVSNFLLSSDFFVNGSDATGVVRYLGYYDPFKACSNPFARPLGAGPPVG